MCPAIGQQRIGFWLPANFAFIGLAMPMYLA
jgi:hypothetical protein